MSAGQLAKGGKRGKERRERGEKRDEKRGRCGGASNLGVGALADGKDTVLGGMEDLAHLSHGLRVGGVGGEMDVPVQAPV